MKNENKEEGLYEQPKDRTDNLDKDIEHEEPGSEGFVAPGVPIVRSSTPRQLANELIDTDGQSQSKSETTAAFPEEAPSAPPLPEEYHEAEEEALSPVEATPLPGRGEAPEEVFSEFTWLFEYGLEMDSVTLNSAEGLHGQALLYGPATLRDYEITSEAVGTRSGQVVATIVPSSKPGSEVWGVLYRIPSRLLEPPGNEMAQLDKIHAATPPNGLFERISVTVCEAYRGRDIPCITYIASPTARNLFHSLPSNRQIADNAYLQQLLETAKKLKLPDTYLQELIVLAMPAHNVQPSVSAPALEQNTEPLPVLRTEKNALMPAASASKALPPTRSVGLLIFAVYLLLSLLAVFTLAILQALGYGAYLFLTNFTLLGIPWFVVIYGYIGGCLSCIVRLSRQPTNYPPHFIVIAWFTRPLIGVILGIMAYLLANSGLFMPGGSAEQHKTLYSLLALLAGSCEGWLFYKR
ncbi:MAG TPA: gamma-glutamylcyclotransferase family protein [Ktedonobacteraceae bacterium]|nr:gamma-glutamylcyclotransferase family protein [Ktedonobacteraceae bacterium]